MERRLAHLLHSAFSDGSRVSCGDLVAHSAASHRPPGMSVHALRSVSAYFHATGTESANVSFFRVLITEMREPDPSFGTRCYVDSTPLSNDLADIPINAFSSHGTGAASPQSRLVIVLDDATVIPA